MKLKDMLAITSDDQLWEALMIAYPRLDAQAIEDHVEVARQLRSMEPEPPEADDGDPVTTIVVERKRAQHWEGEGKGSEFWFNVTGRGATGTSWAIEFMPWAQWLGLEVVLEPEGTSFRAPELLAHCLYEMTFCGFTQQAIQGRRDHIIALKEEISATLNNDHEADGA